MVTDEELLELAKEAPAPDEAEAPVEGACTVCPADGGRPARYRCVRCSSAVCPTHYWVMFGLCHGCASRDDVEAFRRTRKVHPRDYLGIKWVEE